MSERGCGRCVPARVFLLLALFVFGPLRSVVAEEARLRIFAHPEFARLVLESAGRAVGFRVMAGTAELRLDPAGPITVPPLPVAARTWLLAAEARDQGERLALALAPDVTARLVESGPGRVVVDLVRDRGPPQSLGAEPGPEPTVGGSSARAAPPGPTVRVRTGEHPGFRRLVVEGSEVDRLGLRLEAERIEIVGPSAALPPVVAALERLTSTVARVQAEEAVLRVELLPGVRVLKRAAGRDRIVLDLVAPTTEATAPTEKREPEGANSPGPHGPASASQIDRQAANTAGSGAGSSPDCRAIDPRRGLCVRLRTAIESAEVTLLAEPRPGAAVLTWEGALWLVLDRVVERFGVERLPVETGLAVDGDALVRSIRRQPHPEATVLRLDTKVPVNAEAEPAAYGWRLRLRPGLELSTPSEGRILRLVDPPALVIETAAKHVVLPAALLGSGVSVLAATEKTGRIEPRRFVDLEILPTTQGVAWRALAEDLRARRVGRRWLIDRPGGLRPDQTETSTPRNGGSGSSTPVERPAESSPTATAPASSTTAAASALAPAASGGATVASSSAAPTASPTNDASGHGPDRRPPGPGSGDRAEGGAGGAKPASPSPSEVTAPGRGAAAPPGGAGGRASDEPSSGAPPTRGEPAIGLARLASTGEPGGSALSRTLLDRRGAADAEARAAIDRSLAREALARGRAAEALALLGDPPAASDTAAEPPADLATRALAGVAAVLLDRVAAGERLLDDSRLAADPEVALWRAVAAARALDWPRAARSYAVAGRTLQNYPPLLQRRLAPVVGRILLESGKPAAALAVLDLARRHDPDPREAARIALVEGLALQRHASLDAAAAAFRSAAEAGDPPTAIEARYRLARLEQARGRSDPDKLSVELGRQRLLWRDHPAEPEMLAGLVEVLAAAGRPAEALAVARDLRTRYPNASPARAVTDRMRDWLLAAVEAVGEGPSGAVAGLRLLRAHPDLVPDGEAGVGLARALARRLVAAGLPGAAASVLSEYGLPRLRGPARAELVLEVAELLLRAGDPGTVPALLDAEAGTFAVAGAMRARAEALRRAAERRDMAGAVPADAGASARARLEAAWRERDWPTVVEAGTALLAGATVDEAEGRRLLLRVAVALEAEGRADAARELIERHASVLQDLPPGDPMYRLFGLLSGRSGWAGDALQVAAALDGELAALRSGLARGR